MNPPRETERTFAVNGMHCAACATHVEQAVSGLRGVEEVHVNIARHTALIRGSELPPTAELQRAVQSAGYQLLEINSEQKATEASQYKNLPLRLALLFTGPLFVLSMWPVHVAGLDLILALLATPVVFYSGSGFFVRAWKMAMRRQAGMDTLVALGSGSAYLFSLAALLFPRWISALNLQTAHVLYFETAAVIITLILFGKHLEHRATSKAGDSLKHLLQGQPKECTLIIRDSQHIKPIDALVAGDLLLIKPGQVFPVDGIIRKGNAYVREEMLTGEAEPVAKASGDRVMAGSINLDGVLEIETQQAGKERLIEQIADLVSRAQTRKSKIQVFADRISGVFAISVALLSMLNIGVWLFFYGSAHLGLALYTSLSILVIACPCALGLATPTAMMVGMGRAAASGIVVRDGTQFQLATQCTDIVFDKTGTLTEVIPGLKSICWEEGVPEDRERLLDILFTLESYSTHPLAASVVAKLGRRDEVPLNAFREVAGKGLIGRVGESTFFVGNSVLMLENDLNPGIGGGTWFAGDRILARLDFEDVLRPGVHELVAELRNRQFTLHLISGDAPDRVEELKHILDIDFAFGAVLPSGKMEYVNKLKHSGKRVAMLGDGINDGPALAHADVGIAMSSGSDLALEHAGINLLHADLRKLLQLFELSRITQRTIYQNYFWAFGYNVVAIPIAAGILYPLNGFLLNPMLAAGAMAFSSISVILNSRLQLRSGRSRSQIRFRSRG